MNNKFMLFGEELKERLPIQMKPKFAHVGMRLANFAGLMRVLVIAVACMMPVVANAQEDDVFSEGFDGLLFPPQGWARFQLGATVHQWVQNKADANNQVHTGAGSAEHPRPTGGAHEGWLVTPQIEILSENSTLEFYSHVWIPAWWDASSSGGVWISEGSKDPADDDFIELRAITAGEHTQLQWTKIEVNLGEYVGKNVYIGFKFGGGTNAHRWLIDEVSITDAQMEELEKEALPPVINIQPLPANSTVAENTSVTYTVTATSLDDGELTYQWYSNTTASDTDGTEISGATLATFEPATDEAGTFYYYVVITNTIEGDDGDLTATVTSSVVTLNVYATYLTLLEDFEDTAFLPANWAQHRIVVGGGGNAQWMRNTVAANVRGTAAARHFQSSNTTVGESWLVTPQLAIEDNYGLVFWSKVDDWGSTSYCGVWVLIGSNDPRTAQEMFELKSLSDPEDRPRGTYKEIAVSLTEYTGQNIYIGFKYLGGTIDLDDRAGAWNIDDISVDRIIAPFISEQPKEVTIVKQSESAMLKVDATSLQGTLTYQWYIANNRTSNSGGTLIENATENEYEVPMDDFDKLTEYYFYVVVTNTITDGEDEISANTVSSVATVILVETVAPPRITTQPQNATVVVGETATLNVSATSLDGGVLSYQWYRNFTATNTGGEAITGAVGATFQAPTATQGARFYYVVITNTVGDESEIRISTATTVTVNEPNYALLFEGFENTTFPPVGWTRYGGTGPMGVWGRSAAAGYVYNGAASASGTSGMSAHTSWLITPPIVVPVTDNDIELTFWYRHQSSGGTSEVWVSTEENGSNPTDVEFTLLETVSESAATFSKKTISLNDYVGETIYIGFKHANPSMFGASWFIDDVTVDEITENAEKPIIITQPQSVRETVGNPLTLTVAIDDIEDDGEVTYQWYSNAVYENFGGTAIAGATSDTYELPDEVIETAGFYFYYVEITNTIDDNGDGGRKTETTISNIAIIEMTVEVFAKVPEISSQPQNVNTTPVDEFTLAVEAVSLNNDGELTYQWFITEAPNLDGDALVGEIAEAFTKLEDEEGTYYYYVVITNEILDDGLGGEKIATIKSAVATVTVAKINAATPSITAQPTFETTVSVGEDVTLSVTATRSDNGVLSYQWYSNTTATNAGGTEIDGATENEYIVNTNVTGNYFFYVVITNEIVDNDDGGNKTATATSAVANVRITSDIAFMEDFEGEVFPPLGWTELVVEEEASLNPWAKVVNVTSQTVRTGTGAAWHGRNLENVVNMLVTPELSVASATAELTFWTRGQYYTKTEDSYAGIWISTEGAEPDKFVELRALETSEIPDNRWEEITISLAEFVGQDIHIGFRYLSVNAAISYNWYIDDILMDGVGLGRTHALPPTITGEPHDVIVVEGQPATISVAAESIDGGTLSFQWYINDVETNEGGVLVATTDDAEYDGADTSVAGTYYYYVIVVNTLDDNGDGGVKTAVSEPSLSMRLSVVGAPFITAQPQDLAVKAGEAAPLNVTATSPNPDGTLRYQWYSNTSATNSGGTSILGATSATYSAPTSVAGTHYYYVVVINRVGISDEYSVSTSSNVATLTVSAITNSGELLTTNPLRAWSRDVLLHITGLTIGEPLKIYNVTGALVYYSIANAQEMNISLSTKGVYIITNGENTVRVIFE